MKVLILFLVYFLADVRGLGRIAGGEDSEISERPYVTALLTNNGQGAYVQACVGTIVTRNAILSAASCFFSDGVIVNPVAWWRARVGSSYANSGGTVYLVRSITPHQSYSLTTFVNDIAVLRTSLNFDLVPGSVEIARIVGGAYTYGDLQQVWAAGWGVTSASDLTPSDQLKVVQVWLVNQQTCTTRYNGIGFTVTDNMICAGWLDVGTKGQCSGDVGGPLTDANGAVLGVFSRSQGCGDLFYPDINTRVSSYVQWIIATATA